MHIPRTSYSFASNVAVGRKRGKRSGHKALYATFPRTLIAKKGSPLTRRATVRPTQGTRAHCQSALPHSLQAAPRKPLYGFPCPAILPNSSHEPSVVRSRTTLSLWQAFESPSQTRRCKLNLEVQCVLRSSAVFCSDRSSLLLFQSFSGTNRHNRIRQQCLKSVFFDGVASASAGLINLLNALRLNYFCGAALLQRDMVNPRLLRFCF